MRVLTSSIGWVKLTAKAAARPPQAMDSRRLGLRGWVRDMMMMMMNDYLTILEEYLLSSCKIFWFGIWILRSEANLNHS